MQTVLLVGSSWEAAPRDLGVSDCEVTVATSPSEARALGQTFDVGVFDLDLPDPCGVELAEELLSAARIGRAVFFTGASWQPVLRRAAQVGALVEKDQGPAALWAELGL
jgi:DNA-binding NarL/FixJ family response regulator